MNTEELLAERGKTHGEYSDHARCTQNIMRALQAEKNWDTLSDMQKESLHMFAHKMGRIATGNPDIHDHWDDIAGYAKLVSDRIPQKVAPVDAVVYRGEDTEKENMQKFTAAEVTDNLLHQKFPRSATHAEFLSYCRTILRGGTMETKYASSLYVPEQVKATGRYAMKEEYVGEYGA